MIHSWEQMKHHLHAKVWTEEGEDTWESIQECMRVEWDWMYKEETKVDLRECESWRSVIACLETETGHVWSKAWEERFDGLLD